MKRKVRASELNCFAIFSEVTPKQNFVLCFAVLAGDINAHVYEYGHL